MNYTPNLAARSLITRRTGTVGVVVADITNPFYPGAARHPPQRVRARGLPDDPVQRADGRQRRAARRRPGQRRARSTGSSTSRRRSGRRFRGAARADVPVVLVNRYIELGATWTRWSPTTTAEGGSWPRRWSSSGTGGSRSSPGRRTRRRAATASAASGSNSQAFGHPARRDAPPRRPVQPPQRLPVVPRPPRGGAAPDSRVRRERRDRVRSARRRAPRGRPRPRRALDRRLRRHRHGRVGRLQPDDGAPAARRDGPGRRDAAARADRRRSDELPPRRRVFPVGLVHRDTLAAAPAA